MDAKGAKRSVKMLTTNFYKSFSKNILLYMSIRLSKIRTVHTYAMHRTVYFGWICMLSDHYWVILRGTNLHDLVYVGWDWSCRKTFLTTCNVFPLLNLDDTFCRRFSVTSYPDTTWWGLNLIHGASEEKANPKVHRLKNWLYHILVTTMR